jgi:hypothetical protein
LFFGNSCRFSNLIRNAGWMRASGDMGKHKAATYSPANNLRRKAHHGPWNLVISLTISGKR